MKRDIIFCMLVSICCLACGNGNNGNTSKKDHDSDAAATAVTASTVTPVDTNHSKLVIDPALIPYKIYAINAGEILWSSATDFSNYWIIDIFDNSSTLANKNCFYITQASIPTPAIAGTPTPITIDNAATVWEQDYSGDCPDNCDIIQNLLISNTPNGPINYGNNINVIKTNIRNYTGQHPTFYNAYQLNQVFLRKLYADKANITVILIYVLLDKNSNPEILYQGFYYDEKIGLGKASSSNSFLDPNPNLQIVNMP